MLSQVIVYLAKETTACRPLGQTWLLITSIGSHEPRTFICCWDLVVQLSTTFQQHCKILKHKQQINHTHTKIYIYKNTNCMAAFNRTFLIFEVTPALSCIIIITPTCYSATIMKRLRNTRVTWSPLCVTC